MSEHTPGPWIVDEYGAPFTDYSIVRLWTDDAGETHMDQIADIAMDCPDGVAAANARVLAASLDLLRELKAAEWAGVAELEEGGYVAGCPSCGSEKSHGHAGGCTLAAAIAKAEGRT